MCTIRQIIRKTREGESQSKIARELQISRNTVNDYLKKITQSEIEFDELLKLNDGDLLELFDKKKFTQKQKLSKLRAFMPYAEKELKRPGVTRELLWKEYKEKHKDGYVYTIFCDELRLWMKRIDVPMNLSHKAGDKLFVDFTGKKLSIINRYTGSEESDQQSTLIDLHLSNKITLTQFNQKLIKLKALEHQHQESLYHHKEELTPLL